MLQFARFIGLLILPFAALSLPAADWPEFRGADNDGVAGEESVVTEWNADKNVKWKTPLPGPGNGSPIVSNGRVFVTVATDFVPPDQQEGQRFDAFDVRDGKEFALGGRKRSLYCLDRATGKELWVRTVEIDKVMPTHKTNPYSGSSPAADGKLVVQWESSAGLHCYDFEGNKQWSLDLGRFEHMWGYGGSPIIHNGTIYLLCGPGKSVFMAAVDLKKGELLWKTDEPHEGDGNRNENGEYMGSWSTPIIAKVNGEEQLICSLPTRVVGYAPKTGDILWWCEGLRGNRGDLAYSSPLVSGDICVATGGFGGPAIGFRLGGTGDITGERLWRRERNPQSIGSGVFVGDHVYRPNAGPGTIECLDPQTGETVWEDRAAGANYWGSIVAAGGNLYVTSVNGATVVFKPSPTGYEEVAVNKLPEASNSTPAVSNGEIFIRTSGGVYCIGGQ